MNDETVRKLWREIWGRGFMPCCGFPAQFQRGPSAGMSTNIRCAHCGAEWNDTPFGLDRIGVVERGFETNQQSLKTTEKETHGKRET